nr:hypothetical protein BaRGS_026024 [Batillaria attramentaria]
MERGVVSKHITAYIRKKKEKRKDSAKSNSHHLRRIPEGHGQVQASKIESNTYGALHHGGGQPSAGTSDRVAIYSHTTSSDIYNVLQRQPEKRVVMDNIYNTTNDV